MGQILESSGSNWLLGKCDYSQIELRVMAVVAQDANMINVFQDPTTDIHRSTASFLLKIPKEKLTKEDRQKAKACIAEGQLVLTNYGLVPIENIKLYHKVWDGVAFVSHQGLVYQGEREVIEYDGLCATPDHPVFISDTQCIPFGDAQKQGLRLARTGDDKLPVWLLEGNRSHCFYRKGAKSYSLPLHQDWCEEVCQNLLLAEGVHGLGRQTNGASKQEIRADLLLHSLGLYKQKPRPVQVLWGGWDTQRVLWLPRVFKVRTAKLPENLLRWVEHNKKRHTEKLSTWQPANSANIGSFRFYKTPSLRAAYYGFRDLVTASAPVSSPALSLHRFHDGIQYILSPAFVGRSPVEDLGNGFKLPKKKVYDILNAGPRHRFTVSGKLVHNCNFGLSFDQSAAGFQEYAASEYGVEFTLEECSTFKKEFTQKLYPGIGKYHNKVKSETLYCMQNNKAYVAKTLNGRARYWLPGSIPVVRKEQKDRYGNPKIIEYTVCKDAINHPIQGTAADGMKYGVIEVRRRLRADNLRADVILTVHDEMVIEGHRDDMKQAMLHVVNGMKVGMQPLVPQVPVMVEAKVGRRWGEMQQIYEG